MESFLVTFYTLKLRTFMFCLLKVYYVFSNLIVNGLVPLISLVVLNTIVYKQLKKYSQCVDSVTPGTLAREVNLARISCIIVAGNLKINHKKLQII